MARKKAGGAKPSGGNPNRTVAQNRRARHDYDIIEAFECGLALQGSEVKSLRAGRAQLREAYARVDDHEAWLVGAHIAPYDFASGFGGHDPVRARKLLLHRRQIDELAARVKQESLTLVPLSIYFTGGRAKASIALARGRHNYDKRRALATRDAEREAAVAAAAARRSPRAERDYS